MNGDNINNRTSNNTNNIIIIHIYLTAVTRVIAAVKIRNTDVIIRAYFNRPNCECKLDIN